MDNTAELCFLTAIELTQRIRARSISCVEVMEAHLRQIERVNPQVNAIVTLAPEQALAQARAADAALRRSDAVGPLHGLPVAHKDLVQTKGMRTTFGSPIYADFVPDVDDLIVTRIRNAGAILIGKTNTPEFGAGSQTFNPVFGATRNPYDLSKTCGGSSGGAAVALACGMLPIADGSDTGGSLRNPASFCNVVGFRPSPGRVPSCSDRAAWQTLSVPGPMARTVADAALLLSAMAGPHPCSPIALQKPGAHFRQPLDRDFHGVRVAWSRTASGLPIDPEVTAVLEQARPVLEAIGCIVEETEPDFTGADEAFKVWRAWGYEQKLGELADTHRDRLKETILWEIEQGRALTGPQIGRAERLRTALYHRMRRFMQTYEFLALPVVQVPPFPIEQPYVTEINGVPMDTYIDWMRSCYYISITGFPAISVPAGFTRDGLPVGLQLVGRHHNDFGVLQLAHAFEQATGHWRRRPPIV
ncbi:amidase [Roseiflexus sp. RS-1]|uniref:amidase n=1 Tax=Roseiflexus sp. (strain RS-1) TaxID=357808 RepID=UPI0000D81532|nr:amidase [Roseiflexus sp. RS-1]ABQ89659.1 Amidase [Roseiflexus sp. RS-1]